MKGLIIIAALCVLLASSQSNIPTFAEYVVQWNKTYSNTESVSRENIYNQRVALFTSLNALYNMTSAANNFTDWTTDELNCIYYNYSSAEGLQDQDQCRCDNPLRQCKQPTECLRLEKQEQGHKCQVPVHLWR